MSGGREPGSLTFYSAAEIAKMMRIDESTLYRHLRNGTFPALKIGGRYVVPHAVLESLINDVLDTGQCVDVNDWTARWRADQSAITGGFSLPAKRAL